MTLGLLVDDGEKEIASTNRATNIATDFSGRSIRVDCLSSHATCCIDSVPEHIGMLAVQAENRIDELDI